MPPLPYCVWSSGSFIAITPVEEPIFFYVFISFALWDRFFGDFKDHRIRPLRVQNPLRFISSLTGYLVLVLLGSP